MKVAVIGANGQLGSDICKVFSKRHEVLPLVHDDIEVGDLDNVREVFQRLRPDVVINTAAFHNVPKCEDEPELAFKINGLGAKNLARAADQLDIALVHYSTDYVFDGKKAQPYLETDAAHPLNIYGLTKLNGEYLAMDHCRRHFVVRISGIYGSTPCRAKGGNFVTTMMRLAQEKPEVRVVNDEILTPTWVADIARNTLSLVETDAYGLYHMTAAGSCSWFEFAQVIFSTLEFRTPLLPCTADEFPSPVKRPAYSVLENGNLQISDLDQMPHWRDSLVNFLQDYVNKS